MLHVTPISFAAAKQWITDHHRHHGPVVGDKYRVAVSDAEGIVGVAQVGRPKARMLDDGTVLEVVRVAVIEDPARAKNAVSLLLSRCARAAEALGFARIVTYILESESGASLLAAGWRMEAVTGGGEWSRPSRRRPPSEQPGKKTRWGRELRP